MSEADDHYLQASELASNQRKGLTEDESLSQAYQEQGIKGFITKPLSFNEQLFIYSLMAFPGTTVGATAGGWLLRKSAEFLAPNHPTIQDVADFAGNMLGGAAGSVGSIETLIDLAKGEEPNAIDAVRKALKNKEIRRDAIKSMQEATDRAESIAKKILQASTEDALKDKISMYDRAVFHLKNPQMALINAQLLNPRIVLSKAITDALNAQVQTLFRAIGVGMEYGTRAGINTLVASVRGQQEALKDGFKYLARSMWEDEPVFQQEFLGQFEKNAGFAMEQYPDQLYSSAFRYLGALGGLGRRSITAIDQFSKTLAFRAASRMITYQEGLSEAERMGLKSWGTIDHFATQYSEHQMAHMSDAMFDRVTHLMHSYTFTDTTKLTKAMSSFANVNPILRIALPYTRTPVNLMTEGLFLSPLAPITGAFWRGVRGADAVEQDIAMAKWALGSLTWGVLGHYVANGTLVGNGPQGPGRQYWPYRHRPNSWRMGEHSYGFNHLGPFGDTLAHVADAWETYYMTNDPNVQHKLAQAGIKLSAEIIQNNDYMEFFTNLVHASDGIARGNTKALTEFLGRESTGFLPAPVRMLDHVISPGEHQAQTQIEEMKQNIPFYSATLPYKRDQWGEIVYPPTAGTAGDLLSAPIRAYNELSPVPIYRNQQLDPVEIEHYRLGIAHRDVPNFIYKRGDDTVPLTPQVQDEWRQLMGNQVTDGYGRNQHDALEDTINSPSYQNQDDFIKKKRLDDVHSQYFHRARAQIFKNYPDIHADVNAARHIHPDPVEIDPVWKARVLAEHSGENAGEIPTGTK